MATKTSDLTLLTGVPIIKNSKQIAKLIPKVFIIEDYLNTKEDYVGFQTQIRNLVRGCFVIRACREYPISFKFRRSDRKKHTLQLRHFLINVFLWYPFIELRGDLSMLDETFILDCMKDIPNIEDYMNEKLIETLRDAHVKSTKINFAISEVLFNLRYISIDFGDIMGLNFSAETFIDLYNNHEEMNEIMNCTFEPGMQPYQIENKVSEYQQREVAYLKSLPDNPIGIILRSGTGIKHKQLAEFTIAESLKPDLTGKTIPIPIETSTMIGGLDSASSLYVDASGARKSSVMNKKVMGKQLAQCA